MEIRADGTLDYPDEVLAKLDFVIASLHVSLRQPREQVTERLLNAIRNPHVDMIGHPTGRLIPSREGADLDMDAILSAAKEHNIVLEINASPYRLDLDATYARRAKEMGIKLAINTDAHSMADFDVLQYGIGTARRAWLTAEDVINTWPIDRLLSWITSR
jgi:DNA polymerase (family 10)